MTAAVTLDALELLFSGQPGDKSAVLDKGDRRLRTVIGATAANLRALADELDAILEAVPEGTTMCAAFMHADRLQHLDYRLARAVEHLATANGLCIKYSEQPIPYASPEKPAANFKTPAEVLDEMKWRKLAASVERAAATKPRAKAKRQAKRAAAKGEAGNTPA